MIVFFPRAYKLPPPPPLFLAEIAEFRDRAPELDFARWFDAAKAAPSAEVAS